MRQLWQRLQFLFHRRRLEADLDEEMRLHRELRAQKLGDPQAAQRRFGNTTRLKEDSREAWTWPLLESVAQDIRYAARVLKNSPVFTISAVATLALGIGANTALFTLINALLLTPLPIHEPNRLMQLSTDRETAPTAFCYRALEGLAPRTKTLEGLFTWYATDLSGGQSVDKQTLHGAVASGNAFRTLGIHPEIGRFFTPQDDSPQSPLVAVLSDHLWQSRFNRNPDALGKTIVLDRHPFIILGVLPKNFYGMSMGENPNFVIPIHAAALLDPQHDVLHETNNWWLPIFGRLKPGVSMLQANAELRVLSRSVFQTIAPDGLSPSEARQFFSQTLLVISGAKGPQFVADQYRQPLLILIAISGLVLLVACINIASLLLARAAARSREISVRLAVGAARWRIIRQLLTESFLLSTLGATVGALLAWAALPLIARFLPFTVHLAPDWRIASFLALLVILTALLFGAAPAFAGTDFGANEVLKQGRAVSPRHNRLNKILVSGQIALSLVLLMGAFLFIQTFENLKWQNFGFDPNNLVFINLNSGRSGLDGPPLAQFYRQLINQTARVPSVRSISLSGNAPMAGTASWTELSPDLWPNLNRTERTLYTRVVSPSYFSTLRIPILQGRDFNKSDEASSEPPPAIITKSAARNYFPKQSAVGQILRVDTKKKNTYRIIGVIGDSMFATPRDQQARAIYTDPMHAVGTKGNPFTHGGADWCLAVRVKGDPSPLFSAVKSFVKQSGKDIVVTDDLSINTLIDQGLRTQRLMAILASCFAAVTAVLVALGLYGLLAYTVTRRTSEIGIRLALGAARTNVLWLFLKDALILTTIGILVGVPAVLASGKLISSMLFKTAPSDPALLTITVCVMFVISASAAFVPAWRATKIDPATALRWE